MNFLARTLACSSSRNKLQVLLAYIGICVIVPGPCFSQAPLDQLKFKGTHNSYACCGGETCIVFWCNWDNSCPVMHNPLGEQIDDYGVWALELDFSVEVVNGSPVLYVGHNDSQGIETWSHPDWGVTLRDFLIDIRNARAFPFRPVMVFFDYKDWGHPDYNSEGAWGPVLHALVLEVFGESGIFGPGAFAANNSQWPTVPELAGKVIPYNSFYGSDYLFGGAPFSRWIKDDYTNASQRASMILSGNYTIISPDQYQENWTFDLTAPPNPVYVQSGAPESFQVVNQYGHDCDSDPYNVGRPFQVSQQGTFRFPFNQVGEAVNKAEPGWTILIQAGSYPETLTISKPLTLMANGGDVVIGN